MTEVLDVSDDEGETLLQAEKIVIKLSEQKSV